MSRKLMMVLAASLLPVACGTLSPTSPEEAVSGAGGSGTVASMGRRVPPPTGPTCAAEAIALSSSSLTITAQFTDAKGTPVSAEGCPAVSWSVSPEGAYVREVSAGPVGTTQVELVVAGLDQTYTVTATSGALTASITVGDDTGTGRKR